MIPKLDNFIALDTETTGLESSRGKIIEVAALRYKNGEVVDRFDQLINPGVSLPEVVTGITGVNDEDLASQPAFSEIKDKLEKFIGDRPVVGHNVEFDLDFLEAEGLKLRNQAFDTFNLATVLFPTKGSYSLESLADLIGIEYKKVHRAGDDAKLAGTLFLFLREKARKLDFALLKEINRVSDRADWSLAPVFREAFASTRKDAAKGTAPAGKGSAARLVPPAPQNKIAAAKRDYQSLDKILKPAGKLEEKLPGYEFRPAQVKMMTMIASALPQEKKLIIEAGSGIGKSLAYLVPAVYFAKSEGKQVVVSTYTRNLQDQLYSKDLALVQKLTPFRFSYTQLKGWNNYLCRLKFSVLAKQEKLDSVEISALVKLILWLNQTKTGEIDEVPFTREEYHVKMRLRCDRESCLGDRCPKRKGGLCFHYTAREKAKGVDIVVVNHALLVSDAILGEDQALAKEYLIIDEAHHLEDGATNILGFELNQKKILADLENLSLKKGGGVLSALAHKKINQRELAVIAREIDELASLTVILFGLLGMLGKKLRPGNPAYILEARLTPEVESSDIWLKIGNNAKDWIKRWHRLADQLKRLEDKIAPKLETEKALIRSERLTLQGYNDQIRRASLGTDFEKEIYWVKIFGQDQISLFVKPLHVSRDLHDMLWDQARSAILTSATLRLGGQFGYFRERLGLGEGFKDIVIPPIYDFEKQVLVYLPQALRGPTHPEFAGQVTDVICQVAGALQGRTLALFTSFSGIKAVYGRLQRKLARQGISVLAQKVTGSRKKIIGKFRLEPDSVILGTSSFWQGVDLPGDQLRAVIIVKLPFDVPSEPVFEARQAQYDNGFTEYALPRAILRFRQGFGRLIRSRQDKGAVIVLDKRVQEQRYGDDFLQSLPESTLEYGPIDEVGVRVREWLSEK